MRTLIDINDELLQEALALTNARSKKEVVHLALEELTRARLRQQLKEMAGSGILEMGLDDLRRIRRQRLKKHQQIDKSSTPK